MLGCSQDDAGGEPLGSEYMASSIVRGCPDECLSVLVDLSSNTTILGPASKIELLEDGEERQVGGQGGALCMCSRCQRNQHQLNTLQSHVHTCQVPAQLFVGTSVGILQVFFVLDITFAADDVAVAFLLAQVLRLTVEATGMARRLCAPREVIVERLFKR